MFKTKIYILVILYYCIFFMSGCIGDNEHGKSSIDMLKIVNTNTMFNDIKIEKILFVKLELSDCSLISSIEKIVLLNDNLYIKSFDDLLVFTINGKFKKKIGSIGNGPGEFNNITDFAINEINNIIAVSDLTGKKIILYDLEGNFLQEKRVDIYPYKIEFFDNLFVHPLNLTGDIRDNIIVFDNRLDSICSFPNNVKFEPDGSLMYNPENTFQKKSNEMLFHQLYNDTIYCFKINDKSIETKYIFDFKNKKIPYELLGSYEKYMKEINQYGYIEKILEYRNCLFIDICFNGDLEKYIIEPGEVRNICKVQSRGVKFADYGIFFWPKSCQNDFLIDYINIQDIMDENNKVFNRDALIKFVGKVDEDSNPIIVISQIKAEAEKLYE